MLMFSAFVILFAQAAAQSLILRSLALLIKSPFLLRITASRLLCFKTLRRMLLSSSSITVIPYCDGK
jgi:hypothetical protein